MLKRIRQFPHHLLFFALAALYLWLVIEPHLIYQSFGSILPDAPTFMTGWAFLKDALSLPGGFVMYVSGLLSQGFYHSWLGTAIIVLCMLLLCEVSRRHLVAAGGARAAVLSSVPAVVVFLIYSRYKHPLPACLTLFVGLLCSLVFERVPRRRPAMPALVYCGMAAVVFWWAGAGGLLLFAAMTVIHAIFLRRHWRLAALALPAGAAIGWALAQYVFLMSPRQALLTMTPVSSAVTGGMKTFSRVLVIILYVFVPLSALLLLSGKVVFHRSQRRPKKRPGPTKRKKARTPAGQKRLPLTLIGKTAVTVLPIALAAAGLFFSHDPMSKPFVLAHDYALRKQWAKTLELAARLPKGTSNPFFNHDIVRALYHTGRLPEAMFDFPQTPHGLLLTHEKKVSYLTQARLCDTFLELGQVNLAQKLASEILAAKNHSAPALEKMAWIHIIKGHHDTARVYLNVLRKDLVYRRKAETLLGALDGGFSPEQTSYVDRIRSCMHQAGHPGTGKDSIEQMLTGLLQRNRHNQMAFEYLMACYLLTGRADKVVANMERLGELGYQEVPVLYEEALLIYLDSQKRKIDLSTLNLRPETIQRYMKFVQLRNSVQPHNRQAVLQRLIVEFGHSYFFYFTFGCVGVY
ncbi:MAG: hypothetical protein JW741_24235 [Sedimentisphaerales bacterium]|nr:hypothetical protein [Sedimentisphaerales bacterium]